MKFVDANNILYKHQYGFRAKHSTIHPVLHLLNHCAEASNTTPSPLTLATFCDLSKAFDMISPNILLSKLNTYGIRGVANKWIESYINNRIQYVDFDSTLIYQRDYQSAVVFHKVRSLDHFLIYINDISHSTHSTMFSEHILSFADNTTVFLSDSNPSRLFNRANTSMDTILNWFCANKLSLNASKTQYMVIQPHT